MTLQADPAPLRAERTLKLQQLRVLLAIADSGTFSGAALDLDASQSTVSNAVAELEAQLGVRLFERGRFGARPTEVGLRVIEHARRLETTLDAIEQEAALARGALRGRLRVHTFRSVATHILPAVLARLRDSHPHLAIAVSEVENLSADGTAALLDGRADLAITTDALAGEAVFWELLRDPFVAVAPAGWREPAGAAITLEALARFPVVFGDGACWAPLRERLESLQPGFRPAFEVSQDSTILSLVAQGLGVAVMPALALGVPPEGVRRLALAERLERRVGVALAPGALKLPAARAFLSALREPFPASEIPHLP